MSQIPRKRLSFLFVCSVLMGRVLVNSNLLYGERFTLNRNAVMELLIYLSGPVYPSTKGQRIRTLTQKLSVVGDGPVSNITETKGTPMLHKDVGNLPCLYEVELYWQLYVNLIQVSVIWEERTPTEKTSSLGWPVGKPGRFCRVMIDKRGSSSLRVVPPLGK